MTITLQLDPDATLPDFEVYVAHLWTAGLALLTLPTGETITPHPDNGGETGGHIPVVYWSLTATGDVSNGPDAWSFLLNVSIVGLGMDGAKQATSRVHQVVSSWNLDPNFTSDVVGSHTIVLASVDDSTIPTRTAAATVDGRDLVQYDGSYLLLLRAF